MRVDNSMQKNCRWYSGSGIYRNVWLIEQDKAHIADWGLKISTPDTCTAVVAANIVNESGEKRNLKIKTTVAGETKSQELSLAPAREKEIKAHSELTTPNHGALKAPICILPLP